MPGRRVKTQIWIIVTVYLLVAFKKSAQDQGPSLHNSTGFKRHLFHENVIKSAAYKRSLYN
jgi:hypothetical protein